jgi:hypothetical protein
MSSITSIIKGHWSGFYEYDAIYNVGVSKATFRMILDDVGDGRFRGKCIDLEGAASNSGVANIKGFMENSFISFTKEYPRFFEKDKDGNQVEVKSGPKPLLNYIGHYDWLNKTFEGTWEILIDDETHKGGNMVVAGAGKWKMSKV